VLNQLDHRQALWYCGRGFHELDRSKEFSSAATAIVVVGERSVFNECGNAPEQANRKD
jgi:hypothetical protein